MSYTLAIIKPDAIKNLVVGDILGEIESTVLDINIAEMKMVRMSTNLAEAFYAEHVGKPFFNGLIAHMTSGPCIVMMLHGANVVNDWRRMIGPTDPSDDDSCLTLRAKYGEGLPDNALHGSATPADAEREAKLLFPDLFTPWVKTDKPAPIHIQRASIPEIRFQRIYNQGLNYGKLPTRATAGSAGWDIYSAEDVLICPGRTMTVSTGLKIAVPFGYEAQVRSRSGLALSGLVVANSPGTIDSDYRGELKVIIHNTTDVVKEIKIGDRIAQLVLAPVQDCLIVDVESLDSTERGDGGFGSTGR